MLSHNAIYPARLHTWLSIERFSELRGTNYSHKAESFTQNINRRWVWQEIFNICSRKLNTHRIVWLRTPQKMHSIWMEAGVVNLPSISVALHNLSNYKLINIKFVRQTFLVLLLIITFLISLYPYSAHFAMYLRVMPSVIQCDSSESAQSRKLNTTYAKYPSLLLLKSFC